MTRTTTKSTRPGITFAVDPVTPAATPLKEIRAHEALRHTLNGDVESCSDYHGTVVAGLPYQPLLAAVVKAFAEHRPLVLSPDAVWITIAQGVAHHMAIHGEQLRSRFVSHTGKLDLEFTPVGWVPGSPENPWPEAFESWAGQIREHVGAQVHDLLGCDFSTTGPVERAASDVVMMDVFERYFHYHMYCICGIPTITLEGTSDDWQRLRDKAAGLAVFDMDWWLAHLLPICDHFARASRGDADASHWRDVCQLSEAYGGDVITGWITKLFPYLRSFPDGPCRRRNPVFDTGDGFQSLDAPTGLSRVPFTWGRDKGERGRSMEAIGGLVGVAQDPDTLALRPKVGWAVREASPSDVHLARLEREHRTFPPVVLPQFDERGRPTSDFPPDLSAFFFRADGAELFKRDGELPLCRIVGRGAVRSLDWGEQPEKHGINTRGRDGRIWHRFADLRDGSWLAINLDPNRGRKVDHAAPEFSDRAYEDESFAPVCHGSDATQGRAGANPVVALSFSDLLAELLDHTPADAPLWFERAGYVSPYGDAERFTRRD